MIYEEKKILVQNLSGRFFTFVKEMCMDWNVLGVCDMRS